MLFANWILNFVVLAVLVVLKWATIQDLTGPEAMTGPILLLLVGISLVSLVGEVIGMLVASAAAVVTLPFAMIPLINIIWVLAISCLIGWVEMGILEWTNLGFN
ncbi:MAG: hypothetical protein ACRCXZ_07885 [Patescibacteria group bacterium]